MFMNAVILISRNPSYKTFICVQNMYRQRNETYICTWHTWSSSLGSQHPWHYNCNLLLHGSFETRVWSMHEQGSHGCLHDFFQGLQRSLRSSILVSTGMCCQSWDFCTHNPVRSSSTPQAVTSLGVPKIQWKVDHRAMLLFSVCLCVCAHEYAFVSMWKSEDNVGCHPQGRHLPPLLQNGSLSWSWPIRLDWLTSWSQGPSYCHLPSAGIRVLGLD